MQTSEEWSVTDKAFALAAYLLEDSGMYDQDKDKPLIAQCSWCRRIRQPDGSYAPGTPAHGNITHGICPECRQRVEAEIAAHGIQQKPLAP